jgi:bifunctional ADP-heptose synthase (sugar kinase/adenylyltransferase)
MAAVVKHLEHHLTHRHNKKTGDTPSSTYAAPAAWDKSAAAAGDAPKAAAGASAALTVGCFDVCHRGHKVLVDRLLAMGDVVSVGCVGDASC